MLSLIENTFTGPMMLKINFLLATLLGTVLSASAWAQTAPRMDLSAKAFAALCSNKEDAAAQNFCFGFGEGVYQGYIMNRDPKAAPTICAASENVTREEVLKDFLAWLPRNAKYEDEYAASTLITFLLARFPCKK